MRALFPVFRLAAIAAEQLWFERMKRGLQRAPNLSQIGLAQPAAAITSDFKKPIARVQRGTDGGGRISRPAAEHDRVPGIAFKPVSLAIFLTSLRANLSRLLHVLVVEAAGAAQFLRLRLAVAAGQRKLNHSGHASSEHFGADEKSPTSCGFNINSPKEP